MKAVGRRVVLANRMRPAQSGPETTTTAPGVGAQSAQGAISPTQAKVFPSEQGVYSTEPPAQRPSPAQQSSFPDLRADVPKTTEESLEQTKEAPSAERLQYQQPPTQAVEQVHAGTAQSPSVQPTPHQTVPEGEHPPTVAGGGQPTQNIYNLSVREERDRLTYETVQGAGTVGPTLLLQCEEAEIWLIAGAEGSLGLQFVKQALDQGNAVVALCQNAENINETYELRELISQNSTRSCIVACNFSDADSMLAAALEIKRLCGTHPVDVFINASGIAYNGQQDIMKCTAQDMMRAMDIEVLGPLYFLQNILPFMESAAKPRVVLTSSIVGSNFNVQRDYRSRAAPFCVAKAAVNMLTTCFRAEMPQGPVIVAALHPGWASTKEGITPETNKQPPNALVDCVRKCMRTINHLDIERHGLFIDYQGSQLRY